jgi:hypothetical protein
MLFDVTYQSLDPAPLELQIAPCEGSGWANPFPSGVSFNSVTATLQPAILPGTGQVATQRNATLPASIVAQTDCQPGAGTGAAIVTVLSESSGAPPFDPYVPVKFDIVPVIHVSVSPEPPAQKIELPPKQPVRVKLEITAPGSPTTVQFKQTKFQDTGDTPGAIEIGWPSSQAHGQMSVGGGTLTTWFTLTAPSNYPQGSPYAALRCELTWTAYNGQASGSAGFTVYVQTQILTAGDPPLHVQ